MPINHQRESTFGLLTYLFIGAAVALTMLLGTVLVGLETVRDALSGAALHTWIKSGDAFLAYLVAFLIFMPFAVLGVSAVMGRRAATTGNAIGGQAAVTTLFGVLVAWVSVALALLIAAAIIGVDGTNSGVDEVTDLIIEGFLYVGLALIPLLGLAALTARFVQNAFTATDTAPTAMTPMPMAAPMQMIGTPSGGSSAGLGAESMFAWPSEPVTRAEALFEHPVNCPRCATQFNVSGDRPLRIECPACGKTGTIR